MFPAAGAGRDGRASRIKEPIHFLIYFFPLPRYTLIHSVLLSHALILHCSFLHICDFMSILISFLTSKTASMIYNGPDGCDNLITSPFSLASSLGFLSTVMSFIHSSACLFVRKYVCTRDSQAQHRFPSGERSVLGVWTASASPSWSPASQHGSLIISSLY